MERQNVCTPWHIVDKVVMVNPLTFLLQGIFSETEWGPRGTDRGFLGEGELQDVSGGDDDDGDGGDEDRSQEVKERFGIDDTVGDVDTAVEGDVKSTEPTVKPDKRTRERSA